MTKTVMIINMFCLLCFSVWSEEDILQTITVGEYTITLPASWKPVHEPEVKEVLAKRYVEIEQSQVPIGELMGSTLKGSVAVESGEMENSAKQNPRVARLLDAGKFETLGGQEGRKVLIALAAQDPSYGNLIIFYSIYLPQADGSSITFKLRCGRPHSENLRKEFESIVSNVIKSEDSNKPEIDDKE